VASSHETMEYKDSLSSCMWVNSYSWVTSGINQQCFSTSCSVMAFLNNMSFCKETDVVITLWDCIQDAQVTKHHMGGWLYVTKDVKKSDTFWGTPNSVTVCGWWKTEWSWRIGLLCMRKGITSYADLTQS
jgi:hypothetical protein